MGVHGWMDGTPCPKPRSRFGVRFRRITFTISWNFLLLLRRPAGGGSNKTHCPLESRSPGRGLGSNLSVELVKWTVYLGKITEPSSSRGKEEYGFSHTLPLRKTDFSLQIP